MDKLLYTVSAAWYIYILLPGMRFVCMLYFLPCSEADSASAMEYRAAVRIQSWFRGCRVRAYYSHLHAMARIIQRNFRGHLGREEYRRRLEVSGEIDKGRGRGRRGRRGRS